MENSLLLTLLNSFEPNELKNFRSFLISPYFNKNKNVIKLFDYLTKMKKSEFLPVTNEEIHINIFKEEKFNNENTKTIIYLLTRLCEKFLVIKSFEEDETEYNRRLLKIFDKKGLDKHFKIHQKRIEKKLPEVKRIEINTLYSDAEFEKTLIEFCTKRNLEKEMFTHELKLGENLMAAFFVDMFKQQNIFWRVSYLDNIKTNDFSTSLLESTDLKKLFRIFEEKNFPYKDLLKPYYAIYCFLNDDGNFDIQRLKESIINNSIITENEKFILSTILVNTLYYKNLKMGNQFSRELFEAFKMLLLLYKHSGEKHLRYTIFSNVLRMGLQLGEYEWTENFIKNSHVLLEPSIKLNMFNYSNAYLSFAKGDFDKCLEFESKINYDTFQQRYYLRDLRLCSLYELGKFETALSLIDSYKHFIKKDKSYSANMKKGYSTFLSIINDLIRLKLGITRKEPGDIKNKLENSATMRKDWLLKKFDDFK